MVGPRVWVEEIFEKDYSRKGERFPIFLRRREDDAGLSGLFLSFHV